MGHPEGNEREARGINRETVWGISAGNRSHFLKQNLHRGGIAPFPCRLLSDSTSSQVMRDVPHDACRNSLIPRCRLWNRTKHYVYCNKCRGGGDRNLGERKKLERFFCQTEIIAIGPHVHSDSHFPIPDHIPAILVQASPRRS